MFTQPFTRIAGVSSQLQHSAYIWWHMRPTYSDIGCKLALEDKERVAFRRRQRHEHVDATRHAKPCNCSSLASQQQKGHRTKEKLIQFLCSSCLLCVCCPLACVCCFIKLPCRICHQALRCARKWACYGSKNNRVCALNWLHRKNHPLGFLLNTI